MAATDLSRELTAALELVRAAGVEIMKIRGGELGVEMKLGNEPVTIADKRASDIIVAGLGAQFSDPIISEEVPITDGTLAADRLWLVDPIDGTKDFIRGSDSFSVMVGLAQGGVPVLGVVYQPAIDRAFYATEAGAFVETPEGTQPLAVSDVATAADVRLVISASHRSPEIDRVKSELGINNELNVGSVGVKLCLIAMGVRDLYVNPAPKTKVWDTCAPQAILTRAGGKLTDLFGEPIDYHQLRQPRGLLASNGRVHAEVVGKLTPLFESLRH